jgi:DNA-binding response OmpR family regulator
VLPFLILERLHGKTGGTMGAKILLITADSENMAKIEMSLSPRGHEVIPANKLSDAAHLIENDSTIDLVICDLIFPLDDGFELLKQIRADHLRSSTPFIFLVPEEELLTDSLRRAAGILGADKFIFMDSFDPHRMRCEVEALLPEQTSSLPPPNQGPDISANP